MAIGVSASALPPAIQSVGRGGGDQGLAVVAAGLRGVASVGSGLQTGVRVVDDTVSRAAEVEEARARARDAAAEQLRLEREASAAEDTARREELRSQGTGPTPDATASAGATGPSPASGPSRASRPDEEATRSTIQAAVTAGEAGDVAPRGTFLDFSI